MNLEINGLFVLFALVLVVAGVVFFRRRKQRAVPPGPVEASPANVLPPPGETIAPIKPLLRPQPISSGPILSDKLNRTRGGILGKVGQLFRRNASDAVLESEWEQLEEALLGGDVGIPTVTKLLDGLKVRLKAGSSPDLRKLLMEEGEGLLSGLDHGFPKGELPKPYVISVVGVNGAGKTTTVGKLAQHFRGEGKSVLLGAADTFRAAAIGQLKVWADRAGADFVTGREGADPGAVAFDSVTAAVARGIDIVLLDTAGRLHTKTNLMEELKKIHRVVAKVIPEAPHETWLVLDGTAGQNSVAQAKEFQKTLALTGVVVTKLDGTAKGGAILSVASELKLPIRFIGVGESAEDLVPFQPRPFLEAILGS